jgi:hypothetical protein
MQRLSFSSGLHLGGQVVTVWPPSDRSLQNDRSSVNLLALLWH